MTALLSTAWSVLFGLPGRAVASLAALGPARLAVLGSALAAILLWFWVSALRADRDGYRADAQRLESALAESEARNAAQARALQALSATQRADAQRGAFLRRTIKEAEDADETWNGGLAPVLGRAFERLRSRAGRSES